MLFQYNMLQGIMALIKPVVQKEGIYNSTRLSRDLLGQIKLSLNLTKIQLELNWRN